MTIPPDNKAKVSEKQALEAHRKADQKNLSAFVKGINSPEGPSAEVLRWWRNRY